MMLSVLNLLQKWYTPYSRETQFNTLAGKLPCDIVNKIMSFWSPAYPFLDEIKSVFPKIVTVRIEFADELLGDGGLYADMQDWYEEDVGESPTDEQKSEWWFTECDYEKLNEFELEEMLINEQIDELWNCTSVGNAGNFRGRWRNGIIRGALVTVGGE